MCDFCEGGKVVTVDTYDGGSNLDLELHLYGRTLEITYWCDDYYYNFDESFLIKYCPFCGKKLKE